MFIVWGHRSPPKHSWCLISHWWCKPPCRPHGMIVETSIFGSCQAKQRLYCDPYFDAKNKFWANVCKPKGGCKPFRACLLPSYGTSCAIDACQYDIMIDDKANILENTGSPRYCLLDWRQGLDQKTFDGTNGTRIKRILMYRNLWGHAGFGLGSVSPQPLVLRRRCSRLPASSELVEKQFLAINAPDGYPMHVFVG